MVRTGRGIPRAVLSWVMGCLLMLAGGCDTPGPITNFEYAERLVVWGIIEEGSTQVTLEISRTLPLDAVFTSSAASVPGADVVLIIDGLTRYPTNDTLGRYSLKGQQVTAGSHFELLLHWRGLSARSNTTIPGKPQVISARISPAGELVTTLKAVAGKAYAQTWEIRSPGDKRTEGLCRTVIPSRDADTRGEVTLIEKFPKALSPEDTVYVVVHAFDDAYFEYFITRGGNASGQSAGLDRGNSGYVDWNVEGDAIGLMVGKSTTMIIPVRE